jgi:predicted transcriptional regulator
MYNPLSSVSARKEIKMYVIGKPGEKTAFDLSSFRQFLKYAINNYGITQAEFAREYKVSPQHISDILKGNRSPGSKFLKAIGYERLVIYRRKSNNNGKAFRS